MYLIPNIPQHAHLITHNSQVAHEEASSSPKASKTTSLKSYKTNPDRVEKETPQPHHRVRILIPPCPMQNAKCKMQNAKCKPLRFRHRQPPWTQHKTAHAGEASVLDIAG
ncbi:hypothetical protein BO82DRAFT_34285 [Aspergillus uvarum CBS 121591]|uniref:Uncharacterized protein n=1 Tax=Aspergillus uvarum CBS 121591 TaxID=1448315 RepID=A0A319CDB2_9EURO|nr:hypothetical protein BO82DRAFT_34285 [Aspergillus uvarum CBS 121591]PYH83806.1 hypothetical protein BO82DRAFT_34285 [Aspergillus uvarum CBS 121591]